MSRITEVLLLEGGEQIHNALYVSVVHIVDELCAVVLDDGRTGGNNELVLGVVSLDNVLAVAGLLELSCHVEERIPGPLVVLEQCAGVLQTCALEDALAVVKQGIKGYLVDSAVVSAVEAELVEYVAGAVPLGAFQVQNGVNGLVSALDNAVGEVAYLEREQVGGVAGLDSCSQLVVTLAVSHVDVLKDSALAGRIFTGRRNTVSLLEQLCSRGGLVDIPPCHPLDALVDLQVGVIEACCRTLNCFLNSGVGVVGGGYQRSGNCRVCVCIGSSCIACAGVAAGSRCLLIACGECENHGGSKNSGCCALKLVHGLTSIKLVNNKAGTKYFCHILLYSKVCDISI